MYFTSITIDGKPIGKARARSGKSGFYTPIKTSDWEAVAGWEAKAAMAGKPVLEEPVRVVIAAYFKIPKSWPKWKKELARKQELSHTMKPDNDNISKIVCDALNGIVYKDDSYIVDLHTIKFWRDDDEYVHITVHRETRYPSQIKTKPKT
jgi:Holliday junction resolvase RusA-like endonuclease